MLLTWLLKLLTSFIFFSSLFSKSIFSSNGADGYNLSHFCSIYIAKIHTIIRVFIVMYKYNYTSVYTNLPKKRPFPV